VNFLTREGRRLNSPHYMRRGYRLALSFLSDPQRQWLGALRQNWGVWPARGFVRFGSLRRFGPIGGEHLRGSPVDRYYIERFLNHHAADIRGRVLECESNAYTIRFGGTRVTHSDVLNMEANNPNSTYVEDLAGHNDLPDQAFDCIILTQVLQLIYDLKASLSTVYRILKPGGIVLVTVPGITPYHPELQPWNWALTTASAERLFQERFPPEGISVEVHGNIFAAVAFLHGIASEELRRSELDYNDPSYPITIAVRAVKPMVLYD
jgi:SAM-dependent methyltransferase